MCDHCCFLALGLEPGALSMLSKLSVMEPHPKPMLSLKGSESSVLLHSSAFKAHFISLGQWFSTSLLLQPFNIVPHAV